MNLKELRRIAHDCDQEIDGWYEDEFLKKTLGSVTDALFVKTFSPSRVLELLNRIDEAEAALDSIATLIDDDSIKTTTDDDEIEYWVSNSAIQYIYDEFITKWKENV